MRISRGEERFDGLLYISRLESGWAEAFRGDVLYSLQSGKLIALLYPSDQPSDFNLLPARRVMTIYPPPYVHSPNRGLLMEDQIMVSTNLIE